MTIKYSEKTRADGKPEGDIIIDNGDLQALKNVMDQYGFVDQEALLRYALVALLNASDNKLYVKKENNILSVKVTDNLVKKTHFSSDSKNETEAK
ncbi:MAG TPA: hypothetical protein VGC58_02505 [Candidatus Paceibacterota bacterium]